MAEYSDPEKHYTIEYPEGWLPLTHEGSPHISLASLTTGGYLKIEAYQFADAQLDLLQPDRTLLAFLECERRHWPAVGEPRIERSSHNGATEAYTCYTRTEPRDEEHAADFGHARAWVFSRGKVQVRCLYRCRSDDVGVDDDELDMMINSLVLHEEPRLDAGSFIRYYYSLLRRRRPSLATKLPEGLALTLADGQTILLEHLYNHYLLEPHRMEELIEGHIDLLDFCGDDVPDLGCYKLIKPMLFPKIVPASPRPVGAHRIACWPGLAIGGVIQGGVFTYGVNIERLKNWGLTSLKEILDDMLDNLYAITLVAPRGLRDENGQVQAISYVEHPFSASFILFDDFYQTTAHNLGAREFLVGLPDPSCVSCYRADDPRFVVQHTALLRWDYHRSVERLTDAIYLVSGPKLHDVRPYDILHCCPKKA